MFSSIPHRMEHIQQVFMSVRQFAEKHPGLETLTDFLNEIPPEYRSVAFESASMEVALKDLKDGNELNGWNDFYRLHQAAHGFHLDIGLGWALAIHPSSFVIHPSSFVITNMVFDGVGYYHGLFRSRRTVGDHEIPAYVPASDLPGFDQGLGRRLWYNCKGAVAEVAALIQRFPQARHAGLWRGVGIACGYVGGSEPARLEHLREAAGEQLSDLSAGVALAGLSRQASGSVTEDVKTACRVITGLALEDIHADYASDVFDY